MSLNKRNTAPIDPLVTSFVADFANEQTDYIANKVFPVVGTTGETGTFYTFASTKDKYKDMGKSLRRAPGAKYVRDDLNIADSTYRTQQDGVEIPVDKRIAENAQKPYDAKRDAAIQAAERVLIRKELEFGDTFEGKFSFHVTVNLDD